jgi:predicted PurR-regulated permease PerM
VTPASKLIKKPDPEPSKTEPEPLVVRMPVDIRSAALTVLAAVALVAALHYAEGVIIPLVLGLLISYALDPIVTAITRIGVPRALSSALVLLLLVLALAGMAYGVRGQVNSIIEQLPQAARRVRQTFERGQPAGGTAIEKVQKAATELEKAADAATPKTEPAPAGVTRVQVEEKPVDVGSYVVWGSLNLVSALGQAILILFLSFFLLASGDLYRRKLVKIAGPSLEKKKITLQILNDIDRQIESFLLVEAFTSLLVGVATWLAFLWLGLNQAAVWGIAAGVLNTIPYLGPVVVSGGAAVVAFLQFGTFQMAALVAVVAFVITSLEGMLLTPWLTSRAASMNAVAVFVGLLFWGWLWSVWGMLLAVPMLMVIKAYCDHVDDFKAVGELLGD